MAFKRFNGADPDQLRHASARRHTEGDFGRTFDRHCSRFQTVAHDFWYLWSPSMIGQKANSIASNAKTPPNSVAEVIKVIKTVIDYRGDSASKDALDLKTKLSAIPQYLNTSEEAALFAFCSSMIGINLETLLSHLLISWFSNFLAF